MKVADSCKCADIFPLVSVEFTVESQKILQNTTTRKGADGFNWRDATFDTVISLRNADLGFTVLFKGEQVAYTMAKYKENF